MKKIILTGVAIFSISSFAEINLINKENVNLNMKEEVNVKETKELKEDVSKDNRGEQEYDLSYDKNLLNKKESECYVPFSSWHKSVNFYNKCSVEIKNKKLNVEMLSLQNKIRINNEENFPFFYDRITMKYTANCAYATQVAVFNNWSYKNREQESFSKNKMENVNWVLVNSSEKIAAELCSKHLPKIYERALENQKKKLEKQNENLLSENNKEKVKKEHHKNKVKDEKDEHKKKNIKKKHSLNT